MIHRTFNLEALLETMEPYLPITGFYPEEWLANPINYALTDGEGSFALFEAELRQNGLYSGHYFFTKKGRAALEFGREALHSIFTDYPVEVIRGMTPLTNLGARWMNKKLKFRSYGVVGTINGPHELVILTKDEYLQENN